MFFCRQTIKYRTNPAHSGLQGSPGRKHAPETIMSKLAWDKLEEKVT